MTTAPGRITRAIRSCRARATLSRSYHRLRRRLRPIFLLIGPWRGSCCPKCRKLTVKLVEQDGRMWSLLPAVLAGIFGAESLQMAYADTNEGIEAPVSSPPEGWDMEQIAKNERSRVTKMLSSKGQPYETQKGQRGRQSRKCQ